MTNKEISENYFRANEAFQRAARDLRWATTEFKRDDISKEAFQEERAAYHTARQRYDLAYIAMQIMTDEEDSS